MDNVLIDTDVILDFFFDREPFAEFATEIFNRCEEKIINGFTTPIVICNVYYLLRKAAPHQLIIEKIKQLLSIIEITEMNREIVLAALNSEFKDFEDALQNFSAEQDPKIKMIITRNLKDYQLSSVAVLSPEMYLKGR